MGMFVLSPQSNYLMPAHFGGVEGPPRSWTYADVTSILIRYETDLQALSRYVPECFEITQSVIGISYSMCRGVEWMAGGNYNLITVNAPVVYRHADERIEGEYALVVWENKTCPILAGREQTGIPKIFADIEDPHQLEDRLFASASYGGSAFLRIEARKTNTMTPEQLSVVNQQLGKFNWFGWRYIPNTGRPGAALSHPTLYPIENVFTSGWRGEGRVHWQALTWEQNPTQAHIIEALSQLPIDSYGVCAITSGSQVLRADTARELPS